MSDEEQPIHLEHVDAVEGADRLSAILLAIAQAQDKERISIGDLLEALRRRMQDFPEADRAAWFAPSEARFRLLKGQVPILDALLACLEP